MRESCDRCGPQSEAPNHWVKGGKHLWFCNHHSAKYQAALEEQGFTNVLLVAV